MKQKIYQVSIQVPENISKDMWYPQDMKGIHRTAKTRNTEVNIYNVGGGKGDEVGPVHLGYESMPQILFHRDRNFHLFSFTWWEVLKS